MMHSFSKFNLLCLLFVLSSCFNIIQVSTADSGAENPYTSKSFLLRYWNRRISNNLPAPTFLLSKASPLTATQLANLTKLLNQNALFSNLQSFCSSANLFCSTKPSPNTNNHDNNSSSFTTYSNRNFTNYGSNRLGGQSSFKNYSDDDNLPLDSFKRYSRSSSSHNDQFSSYATDGNVVDESFSTYGTSSSFGSSDFHTYDSGVNMPNSRFDLYNSEANARKGSFSGYSEVANSGTEGFETYGRNSNAIPNEFSNYGKDSNVLESAFRTYGEESNSANDTFTSYGSDGNVPTNNFENYGNNANGAVETFKRYREEANSGEDSFRSYVKNSNNEQVNFRSYAKSVNDGSETFEEYGKDSLNQNVGFESYGVVTTFKDYSRKGVSFGEYARLQNPGAKGRTIQKSDSSEKKWVEPGKFFREAMLKEGTVMPMPDIRDKMPKRSFLPKSISSRLPISATELTKFFQASQNSSMAKIIGNTLEECEREPSKGESKMCVRSIEDMIDFTVSVLDRNLTVKTTESVMGSKNDVMIGSVKGINGGNVTQSVSCHQSLFPYLVYYCHSVPKVRVYEADILDVKSKEKINKGVAICHLDTSAWSPSHGAFVALGSSPGQIEVCHWIFENDMTWTAAD